MSELKPCPFCGGEAMLTEYEYKTDKFIYHVCCANKFSDGSFCLGQGGARMAAESAIEAWNGRVTNEQN